MKALKYLFTLAFAGLVFVVGFGYGRWFSTRPAAASTSRKLLYYVDAMHPWYKSDKPGIAPDCGMKLVPVYADGAPADSQDKGKILRYQDPKDPACTSDKPGLNPATGNDLEPVYDNTPPANAIQVAADRQQLAGVRYGQVEWSQAAEGIRANGRVVPDETRITRVQARTEGWITSVAADFTGKPIAKGDPLLTLYSPELVAAQQEYLLALQARTLLHHSSMAETAHNNDSLADAARRRLTLLNLTPAQIADVEHTQKPIDSLTLNSPAAGYIMARNAFPGQRVTAETELYTLTDLSEVWVMAEIFEADASRIRINQAARVSAQGEPSQFARVAFIQPQIDPTTRTMKIRLQLPNPKMRLKPDMFVDVDIDLAGPSRLSVPAEAVIDAGATKTVYLDRGNGYIEPRAVETGERFEDRVEILKGLKAGDRIVISGAFLLNSETQMKGEAGK